MKLSMRTEELSRALYRVQGIADKKSTMPVLAHVLLEAKPNGKVLVSATDLDVGLSGEYQGEVEVPGAVAVQAKQLYEIVKTLPHERTQLARQQNNWIEITSGPSRFELVGMAADEFPALPTHHELETFSVPAKELVQLIDRTLFCVSTDDNRHNLGGVYCESQPGGVLRMVATDGHRLAMAQAKLGAGVKLPGGVIVPRKGFQELKRVLSDAEGVEAVELGFSATNGLLRAGSAVLSTRLVEGQFPAYQQVIPQEADKVVKISRSAFAEALRRVSLLSQNRAHGVRLHLSTNALDLVAEDPELGTAQEELVVEYKGPDLTIGFNARYILDVLGHMDDEGVRLELSDDLSPGVIKPLEEDGFLAVVMPMRI